MLGRFAFVLFTAHSLFASVSFLSELTHNSNTKVGLVTAIQGAAQLITAVPAGWAADRFSRSKVVGTGGVCLLLSIAATSYGVVSSATDASSSAFVLSVNPSTSSIWMILCVRCCSGLGFLGFANGVINGPAQVCLALGRAVTSSRHV